MAELTRFNPKELAKKNVLETELEGFGTILYGKLTMREMADIQAEKDQLTQSYMMVHKMLGKAEPTLTLEELGDWDADAFTKIFVHLAAISDFREKK